MKRIEEELVALEVATQHAVVQFAQMTFGYQDNCIPVAKAEAPKPSYQDKKRACHLAQGLWASQARERTPVVEQSLFACS